MVKELQSQEVNESVIKVDRCQGSVLGRCKCVREKANSIEVIYSLSC